MATSDFHTEKRSNLKRFRERDVDLSNKRLKMCEETGYFLEVRSKIFKVVPFVLLPALSAGPGTLFMLKVLKHVLPYSGHMFMMFPFF